MKRRNGRLRRSPIGRGKRILIEQLPAARPTQGRRSLNIKGVKDEAVVRQLTNLFLSDMVHIGCMNIPHRHSIIHTATARAFKDRASGGKVLTPRSLVTRMNNVGLQKSSELALLLHKVPVTESKAPPTRGEGT